MKETQISIPTKDRSELCYIKDLEVRVKMQEYLDYFDWYTNTEEIFNDNNVCCICGEPTLRKTKGKYYCDRHYSHITDFGSIKSLTRKTPNEIIIEEYKATIIIRDTLGKIKTRATIDLEDLSLVISNKWGSNNIGYISTSTKSSFSKHLHRRILGLDDSSYKEGLIVDHIDGDPTNNTRSNLRITNLKGNSQNKQGTSRNTLGIKGIRLNKLSNDIFSYTSYINIDYKCIRLGTYYKLEEAIKARLQAEYDLFNEDFAPQRRMFKEYNINKRSSNYKTRYTSPIIARPVKSSIKEKHIRKRGDSYTVYKSNKAGYKSLGTFKLLEDAISFRDKNFNKEGENNGKKY